MRLAPLFRTAACAALLSLAALPGWARDIALLIGNSDYRVQPDVANADRIGEIAGPLRRAGFDVVEAYGANGGELASLARDLFGNAGEADRLIVILSGNMVHGGGQSWLLGVESVDIDVLNAAEQGLAVGALAEVGALVPGRALILMAENAEAAKVGFGLSDGLGPHLLPRGVTLIEGSFAGLKRLVVGQLLGAGASVATALVGTDHDLKVQGDVSDRPYMGDAAQVDDGGDGGYWLAARDLDTREAYEAYLRRYPEGANAGAARQRIAALRSEPERRAQAEEEALSLSRDDRRQVQRDLALLGFDPKGIDGLFGPGTRSALASWQDSRGFEATGYLNADQSRVLRRTAARRAEELDREAARRQQQQEAEDRDYWQRFGQNGGEEGLRAYLRRYPDGLYAQSARQRLQEIDAANMSRAEARERQAWDEARRQDSPQALQRYLADYPDGQFAQAARARLQELQQAQDNSAELQAARAEEDRLAGNAGIRVLIEQRLRQLGYDQVSPDGSFDENTRRAIRNFQTSRNIAATGYMTQQTMVHLLVSRSD